MQRDLWDFYLQRNAKGVVTQCYRDVEMVCTEIRCEALERRCQSVENVIYKEE